MERKKAAKAAELEEDALIVEYLRQRQLKEQVILPFYYTQPPLQLQVVPFYYIQPPFQLQVVPFYYNPTPPFNCKLCPAKTPLP